MHSILGARGFMVGNELLQIRLRSAVRSMKVQETLDYNCGVAAIRSSTALQTDLMQRIRKGLGSATTEDAWDLVTLLEAWDFCLCHAGCRDGFCWVSRGNIYICSS